MILIQVDIMAYYYYVTQAAGNLWQNTTCHGVTILAQAPPSESESELGPDTSASMSAATMADSGGARPLLVTGAPYGDSICKLPCLKYVIIRNNGNNG